jgi:hypothetical protein
LPVCLLGVIGLSTYVPTILILGFSPYTTDVGYSPEQPLPFSHARHVEGLGMDCRYCHSTVEQAAFAAVPPTQTCRNCHHTLKADSPNLGLVRRSAATGESIPWQKVHDLPDYVTFHHAIHISKGVGCVTCHGPVQEMGQVYQARTLSMAWCLDCHRQPEQYLRPRDQVFNMTWDAQRDAGRSQLELGAQLKAEYGVADAAFLTSCSTCHR